MAPDLCGLEYEHQLHRISPLQHRPHRCWVAVKELRSSYHNSETMYYLLCVYVNVYVYVYIHVYIYTYILVMVILN